MTDSTLARHAVLLPGTGSDSRFAADAFGPALDAEGTTTRAVSPDPAAVVASYEHALDSAAAAHGPILVGGVSIGAAVALSWALRNPEAVIAVIAALPPWTGAPDGSPAAASARWTSMRLRADGLDRVTEDMSRTSPPWLAATLRRSWASQWPALPDALDEAASYRAPDHLDLRRLHVPVAIVAAVDDPVHPIDVAHDWHEHLPSSTLGTVTLDAIGSDPGVLGRTGVDGLRALLLDQPSCCIAEPDEPRRGP